jgi:hypothetical protein
MHWELWNRTIQRPNAPLSKLLASIGKSRRTTLQVSCLCLILTALPGDPHELGSQTNTPLPSKANWQRVTRHAIKALMAVERNKCKDIFTPIALLMECTHQPTSINFKHFACPVVHPVTGKTILSYKKLMNDPATAETWQTAFRKDFGSMAQGDNKTGQKGMNAMFVVTHDKIKHVLHQGKKITYGNPVVDYWPQKEDLHQIQITAGGNLVQYNSSPSVNTEDLDTSKLHWNIVISTKQARYMCLDIIIFSLQPTLITSNTCKCRLHCSLFGSKSNIMVKMVYKRYIHLEMQRAVWGLPQAGILAKKHRRCKLDPFGYYKHVNTLGLWYHESRPISLTLVVDNFGIKYKTKDDINHLIGAIKSTYTVTEDWTGNLHCSITLNWDYENRMVDILMLGYIEKKLQEYRHLKLTCIQNCPY